MDPVNSYWGMLQTLEDAFRTRYKRRDVNITGMLFARPASRFAQREILPHIDYWHHRSDYHTDFFCPGYLRDDSGQSGEVVANVGGAKWCFSNQGFVTFLERERAAPPRGATAATIITARRRCQRQSGARH